MPYGPAHHGAMGRRDLAPRYLGACSQPDTLIELTEVMRTRDAHGPVMVLSCWAKGHQELLYGVSKMETTEEACRYSQKRFRIEKFFSRVAN